MIIVEDYCAESGLCVGNAYFKHISMHKYTGGTNGRDGVDIKNMTDLVLAKRDML